MAATKSNENPSIYRQNSSKHGVFEDDFLYGVTVAQSSIDYRLGKKEMKIPPSSFLQRSPLFIYNCCT